MKAIDLIALTIGVLALASLMRGEANPGGPEWAAVGQHLPPPRERFLSRPFDIEKMRRLEAVSTR